MRHEVTRWDRMENGMNINNKLLNMPTPPHPLPHPRPLISLVDFV